MSGELEAAGAAITAGLAGAAIERPGKSPPGKHANTTGKCLNCQTPLEGAFCHACGQPAHISRTLAGLMHEFLNAFMNFDTKAWRTLPRLVGRPGTFTYEYIHGHRARYVSPLATFLFTVFVMFFVFSWVAGPDFLNGNVGEVAGTVGEQENLTVAEAQARLADAKQKSEGLNRVLAADQVKADKARHDGQPGAGGRATGIIMESRANARIGEAAVRRAERQLERAKERETERAQVLAEASADLSVAQKEVEKAAPAAGAVVDAAKVAVEAVAPPVAPPAPPPVPGVAKPDAPPAPAPPVTGFEVKDGTVIGGNDNDDKRPWQEQLRAAVESGDIKINSGSPQIDEKVRATLLNPDLALYKLQETASKFSFLLVPISLPFIALLFLWKRNVTFFDHVVFSLYSLSFMSLLFVALAVVFKAGDWTLPIVATLASVVPPIHMFFHMGGAYKLGWWSALWRTAFLLFFIIFAITIFALAILALGLLT